MIAADVRLGEDVVIYHPDLVNLYGCEISDNTLKRNGFYLKF